MQSSIDQIRFLEELSLNAQPALRTILHDGWLLRFSHGYTSRGNSVQTLYSGSAPLTDRIAYCERFYHSRRLPALFKMTQASQPPELDAELERRGYAIEQPVSVQTREIGRVPLDRQDANICCAPDSNWLDSYAAIAGLCSTRRDVLQRMLESLDLPAGYARIRREGETAAVGLGVVEEGWLGLFDVATCGSYRQQGLATAVVESLLDWGRLQGAERAYLQLTKGNFAAEALYLKLGFAEAYTYWYRVKPLLAV